MSLDISWDISVWSIPDISPSPSPSPPPTPPPASPRVANRDARSSAPSACNVLGIGTMADSWAVP